jgi:hypothetical protein
MSHPRHTNVVCDLGKKNAFSKRELETRYEVHNPKKTIRDGEKESSRGGYYAGDVTQ